MKAIVKTKAAPGAELIDAELPKVGPRDALVKIKACSICGTDAHIYEWDEWAQKRVKTPLIFGHEFSGEVVEVGHLVQKVKVGDYVSGETHIADFNCFQCRIGNAHICENLKLRGVDVQGSFAEFASCHENSLIMNDKGLSPEVASAQEPLGNAVHMVFSQEIPGNSVSVFGCGPIGLAAIALCKASGATKIFAVDVNDYRLGMAEKMGASMTLNAKKHDVVRTIMQETKRGTDVFLEVSGNEKALKDGLKSLRPGGSASILGVFPKEVSIDVTDSIVFKQATIRGINGRKLFDTWFKVAAFLKSGAVDLNKIITHKMKFEQFREAFELMKSGNCGKIILYPR